MHRVAQPALGAHRARDEPAGIDPDAIADLLPRERAVPRRVLHLDRRPQGVGGMCRVRHRHVERCENRIALELGDDPAVAFQDLDHHLEVLVEELDDAVRTEVLGQRRESFEIAEQHRRLRLLGCELAAFAEQRPGDVRGDESSQGLADHLAFLKARHHLVERAIGVVELGHPARRQRPDPVELLRLDGARGRREGAHGPTRTGAQPRRDGDGEDEHRDPREHGGDHQFELVALGRPGVLEDPLRAERTIWASHSPTSLVPVFT